MIDKDRIELLELKNEKLRREVEVLRKVIEEILDLIEVEETIKHRIEKPTNDNIKTTVYGKTLKSLKIEDNMSNK